MIRYVKGDITKSDCDIICHQVNCQGAMNSGVAKAIREKWPEVYVNYKFWCDREDNKANLLGEAQGVLLIISSGAIEKIIKQIYWAKLKEF